LNKSYRKERDQELRTFLYRARVEYRDDPLRIGRVKIRIPCFHGIPGLTDEFIKTEHLPWASRIASYSAGYDMGSFVVPEVGSFVYAVNEGGDLKKWTYLGGVHGVNSKHVHPYGVVGEKPDESKIPVGQWDAPLGKLETPVDVYDGKSETDYILTRDVPYKSLKGHTITSENEDEKESFSFIDRAGQVLRFLSPIKRGNNRTGDASFKRSARDTVREDQFDYESEVVGSKSVIFFKDLASQVFRMVAEFSREKIEIISRPITKIRRTVLQLFAGEGDLVKMVLISEDDLKANHIYIEFDTNNHKYESAVVVNGKVVPQLFMTDKGVLFETFNQPFKIEAHTFDGPGPGVSWDDEEDEKGDWMNG